MMAVDFSKPESVLPVLANHLVGLQQQIATSNRRIKAAGDAIAKGETPEGSPTEEIWNVLRSSAEAQTVIMAALIALLKSSGRRVVVPSELASMVGRG